MESVLTEIINIFSPNKYLQMLLFLRTWNPNTDLPLSPSSSSSLTVSFSTKIQHESHNYQENPKIRSHEASTSVYPPLSVRLPVSASLSLALTTGLIHLWDISINPTVTLHTHQWDRLQQLGSPALYTSVLAKPASINFTPDCAQHLHPEAACPNFCSWIRSLYKSEIFKVNMYVRFLRWRLYL